ncbi:carbohydrate ABC transporter permease [Paenibacillus sp. AN1007]|uniref:Carbohydrate ABC transporter permease n=1 Tax=Paenibacillus sp. AN1007 TaxID=3151385 RepID=A0AAU8N942_9BACL
MQKSRSDRLFYVFVYLLTILAVVVTLYPFLYVVSISFSSVDAIDKQKVVLWPVGFTLSGYQMVLQYKELWVSFYNTIWYTVVGTLLNIVATCLAAFPLSRQQFFLRRKLNFFIAFTMYFSGGLIPVYMLITSLGLYNTRWVMVLPVLVITFNVMICRSAFEGIPNEIFESASIDGANEMTMLYRLAVPIIKPTLAVLTLYYAVFHWNNFFSALLYLGKQDMQTPPDVPAKGTDHGFAGGYAEDGWYDDIRRTGGFNAAGSLCIYCGQHSANCDDLPVYPAVLR